jgi:thiol-disulfide isomerase/thioredoxin
VIVYFFWGEGCPHCADEKPFLERLKQQYPVEVRAYEVWYVPENQDIFIKMAAAHGFEPGGVPTTFIGERHWVGYSDQIGREIEAAVKACLASACRDAGQGIVPGQAPVAPPTSAPSATPTPRPVARAVLFWMDGCPHCHEVIDQVLPPLQQKYGDQLNVHLIEVKSQQDIDQLYQLGAALNIPKQDVGVPFLVIGDKALVGSAQIPAELPSLIEQYLAQGGVDWPQGLAPQPLLTATPPAAPVGGTSGAVVQAILFTTRDCHSCQLEAEAALAPMREKYGAQFKVRTIDVVTAADVEYLYRIAEGYGIAREDVDLPLLIIGERVLIKEHMAVELPALIERYLAAGGVDYPNLPGLAELLSTVPPRPATVQPQVAATAAPTPAAPAQPQAPAPEKHLLDLPIFGLVDLDQYSLAFSTVLIGLLDGFNPCSLWVLSLLLALVVNTGSRKKTLLVGLTFLGVAAALYGVIILGLFSVFAFVGYELWIRIAVALIALAFALINIKDYFWFKEGVSLTISDKYKPKLYRDMRGLLSPDKSTLALIGATAAMALGITLVEMPCTAGLPILWTKLIAANNVGIVAFALLLGLYLLMYLADELVVFTTVVVTLRASRLEEKQGRILKLVGGVVMLTLAAVLLVDPKLMDSVRDSALVFGAAIALSLLVLVVHRKVLPRLGIVIGTEALGEKDTVKQSK